MPGRSPITAGLVLGALVLGACSTPAQVGDPPVQADACLTLVAPPGFLAESDEPVEQLMTVLNPGDGTAEILGFDLDDPLGAFKVGAPEMAFLGPGEQTTVPVWFDPPHRGLFAAFISLRASSGPPAEAEVTGESVGPEVTSNPVRVEAGDVPLGCPVTFELSLDNVGEQYATVRDVSVAGDSAWTLASVPDLPLTIPDGQQHQVIVQVFPMEVGELRSELTIATQDPRLKYLQVPLSANGVVLERQEQVWGSVLERDVLFVVDRSRSLSDVHQDLVDAIPAMVSQARSEGIDLHLAAAVGDSGCIVGPKSYIDESFSASDARVAMETMVDSAFLLAPYGSNTERTLSLAQEALSPKNIGPGGCNSAFFRDAAQLHVVSVTDGGQDARHWTYYGDVFFRLKAEGGGFQHHLIGSPAPGGCGSFPASEGLSAITTDTGGVLASICGPIATAVDDVAEAAVRFRRGDGQNFVVTERVIPSTVQVFVGDEAVAGWTFDAAANTVVFNDDALPPDRAIVTVKYARMPRCDEG